MMKKPIICVFVSTLMMLSILTISVTAQQGNISQPLTMGNTLYVGGSGPGNYSKIQDAINNAVAGDTVFVYDDSSPYQENVIVNKSIALIGEDKQTTVIFGVGWNNASVRVKEEGVTIQRFTLTHSYEGIRVDSNNCTIKDNIITGNTEGIDVFVVNNILIEGNVISNNLQGVYIIAGKGTIISGNIITNNTDHGISLSSENALVTLNDISDNGQNGITLGGDNNTIQNNNIIGNGLYGINIWNSGGSSILQNNIYKNKWGNARVQVDLWFMLLYRPFNHNWDGNYWGRPYQLPKPIMGSKYLIIPTAVIQWLLHKYSTEIIPIGVYIPVVKFDWHPAQEPYDI